MRGLAAQLGRVAAGLGVDRVDLEAALERVDDEVAQAVGDGRRVGVDDDQHAPLVGRASDGSEARPAPRRVVALAGALVAAALICSALHRAATQRYRPLARWRAACVRRDGC